MLRQLRALEKALALTVDPTTLVVFQLYMSGITPVGQSAAFNLCVYQLRFCR